MESPASIQSIYYVVATIGVLIATVINIVVVNRNKPDKIKAAINTAVQPILDRMDEFEHGQSAQGQQLDSLGDKVTKMESDLAHAPNRQNLDTIHHRITEIAKTGAEYGALTRMLQSQFQQLNQFLMERGRD